MPISASSTSSSSSSASSTSLISQTLLQAVGGTAFIPSPASRNCSGDVIENLLMTLNNSNNNTKNTDAVVPDASSITAASSTLSGEHRRLSTADSRRLQRVPSDSSSTSSSSSSTMSQRNLETIIEAIRYLEGSANGEADGPATVGETVMAAPATEDGWRQAVVVAPVNELCRGMMSC